MVLETRFPPAPPCSTPSPKIQQLGRGVRPPGVDQERDGRSELIERSAGIPYAFLHREARAQPQALGCPLKIQAPGQSLLLQAPNLVLTQPH